MQKYRERKDKMHNKFIPMIYYFLMYRNSNYFLTKFTFNKHIYN